MAWIHPFDDGNGRTARLLEFQILAGSGIPPLAAHLLGAHYCQTRTEYYRQLDLSARSGGDLFTFVTYAVQGFLDGLRLQLEQIRLQQWDVAWRNYIDQQFSNKRTGSDLRRKYLVLDLSAQSQPVLLSQLPELTPRLAAAYATKTGKTLSRDVNALVQMGLVTKDRSGYRALKDSIFAFSPVSV